MYKILSIIPLAGAALSLGLAVFTLSRNPRNPANIGFSIGMVSLAVLSAGGAVLFLLPGAGLRTGISLWAAGFAFAPPAWLIFSVVFGRPGQSGVLMKNIPVLAAASAIAIFFTAYLGPGSLILPVIEEASPAAESILFMVTSPGRYLFIYVIVALVFNLVHLENTLRASSGGKRWQIKYTIFGAGSVLAFLIYHSSQALLFGSWGMETVLIASAVILISSAMMAVSIVRHRLFDVDVFVSRYVVYNSVTVLFVGLYLIATGLVVHGIKYFNVPFNRFFVSVFTFVSLLVLVVLLFTTVLRRKIQLLINRHFYKHKYEFRDRWMETIEKISPAQTVEEVSEMLIDIVRETVGPRYVYLWLQGPGSRDFVLRGRGMPEEVRAIAGTTEVTEALMAHDGPFMSADAGSQSLMYAAEAVAGVLFAPLMTGDEVLGFLLLERDISGEPYAGDDFEYLKAVTTQAAVQIKNIRLAGDLMDAREMEAFHRMGSFILHDLKNLTNSLSLVSQNAKDNMDNPEFQKDAVKTMEAIVEKMKGLIDRLSQVRRGDALGREVGEMAGFEAADLSGIIRKAVEKAVPAGGPEVRLEPGLRWLPHVPVDPEAVEMVFLNIVKNACEATGEGGHITVGARRNGSDVEVSVTDDGAGMTDDFIENSLFRPFKTSKKGGLGVGLFQCKSIIEAYGGGIDVRSAPGRGTTFRVRLPGAAAEERR